MSASDTGDSPTIATTVGRAICSVLPFLLLSLGWPTVIGCACDLLMRTGSTIEGSGDVGDLFTFSWNMLVGIFIGIQLTANIFRHLERKRYHRNALQLAVTLFLTLLSAACIAGTVFFNHAVFFALSTDDSLREIRDFLVIGIILIPVVGWFAVNVFRLVKKDNLLGRFISY